MMRRQETALARRTVLSGLGTVVAVSSIGAGVTGEEGTASEYVLEQGEECVPIEPIQSQKTVKSLYDYHLPQEYISDENGATEGKRNMYASAGTAYWQRGQTSIAFLYQGPDRLSLVIVHGSVNAADGGSVTFQIAGLPADGEWIVKDDLYRNPDTGERASSNYDRWNVDGTDHRIDWTWGSAGTDGGAFGGLGSDFEVVVEPAFNEAATLHGEHYEGTIKQWEFLSGTDGQERISLGMEDSIRVATGSCETTTSTVTKDKKTETQDEEAKADREADDEDDEPPAKPDQSDDRSDDAPPENPGRGDEVADDKPPENPGRGNDKREGKPPENPGRGEDEDDEGIFDDDDDADDNEGIFDDDDDDGDDDEDDD